MSTNFLIINYFFGYLNFFIAFFSIKIKFFHHSSEGGEEILHPQGNRVNIIYYSKLTMFIRSLLYIQHMKNVHCSCKNIQCTECRVLLESSEHLANHYNSRHKKRKRKHPRRNIDSFYILSCSVQNCTHQNASYRKFVEHMMRMHVPNKVLPCIMADCKYQIRNCVNAQKHIRTKHLQIKQENIRECYQPAKDPRVLVATEISPEEISGPVVLDSLGSDDEVLDSLGSDEEEISEEQIDDIEGIEMSFHISKLIFCFWL